MGTMSVDYYGVLGLSPDAEPDEIKRAFRRLARELHPDATGNDPEAAERYKQVSEAYAVLSDPAKRQRYDVARAGGWGGGSPFASTIEDIFESFFGGASRGPRQRSRAQPGSAVEIVVELTFPEAVFGGERTVAFERLDPCDTCAGEGTAPGTFPERCSACEGSGQVQQVRRTVLGSLVTALPCTRCDQTGWVTPDPCRACGGSGRMPGEASVTVDLPPGISDGDRMRIRGEGDAGQAAGGRGDLYLHFVVAADDRFDRAGEDLLTWAEIPLTVAALGGEVVIESLDSTERIRVRAGTQSGELFRIRGRGCVRRDGGRGDLLVRARVMTPTDLGSEEQDLLRRLAALRGEEPSADGGLFGRLRRAFGMDE